MNRVLDFIETHLDANLSLETLAALAAYSPCHFQREFLAWCGESPNALVRRRRLETGGSRLRFTPGLRIGDVAAGVGFGTAESFARAFRAHFGMTPSQWRASAARMPERAESALAPTMSLPELSAQVQVQRFAPIEVAYARITGGYHNVRDDCWHRFLIWVSAAGLEGQPLIGVGLDDPAITPDHRCRYDICVVLPPGWSDGGVRVARRKLSGGRYACRAFRPDAGLAIGDAWLQMLTQWLPASGHTLGDGHFLQYFEHSAVPIAQRASELRMPLLR